jgi:hypothetical protein
MDPDEVFAGLLASNFTLADLPHPPFNDPTWTAQFLEDEARLVHSLMAGPAPSDVGDPRRAHYVASMWQVAQHPIGAQLKILANQVAAAVLRANQQAA